MVPFDEIDLNSNLRESLAQFGKQVEAFRAEGPLDPVSIAKLEEHFRASHIYHSAGIEGNRLTLQETFVVLKDGIDISGKPLKDSLEVKDLGEAFDFLKTLAESNQTIREADIRSLHSIVMHHEPDASPGEYRKIGVIISGAEHRPPEPLEVAARMQTLLEWINTNLSKDPVIAASVAHHELAAIHPFKDGNGRIARLTMNLILMKHGFPICNIRREERPTYYEALSFADVGIYEAIVQLVWSRCTDLFSEYVRIRQETKRMEEWAERWGVKETEVLQRRESREMELWMSRIRQVFLEFQRATELINDRLEHIELSFYDFKTDITFERYQQLLREGQTEFGNAFSITFNDRRSRRQERFMFRYFRNFSKFPRPSKIIPLELNYRNENGYTRLSELDWANRIRVRELYFTNEGEFIVRYYNIDKSEEADKKGETISEVVMWFFDDILKNIFELG
mgnify:CR=1 FL=1